MAGAIRREAQSRPSGSVRNGAASRPCVTWATPDTAVGTGHAMTRIARTLAVGLVAATTVLDPAAAASFSYTVIDANGPAKIWGKASADVDSDGLVDLLVGSHAATKSGLYWYRNPTWQRTAISTTAVVGTDIEVVDLDGDGVQDVVATTDTAGVTGITLFRRGATGWAAQQIVAGFKLHDLEVADLDGDGRQDLVGRGQSAAGNRLHLWRQRTPGAWTYSSIALPVENGDGLRIADLDRDGAPDLVLPRHWLRNTRTANALTFTRLTYNAAAPANGIVVVGHVDGDDALDIAVAPAHRAGTFSRLAWFKGPTDPAAGAIWPETVIEAYVEGDHHFLGLADFDHDGHADIATAMTELTANPKIKLFYNLAGDGTFAPPQIVADTSSHSMQILEVDNDGYLSLLGADYNRTGKTAVKLWRQVAQPAALERSWRDRLIGPAMQAAERTATAAATLLAGLWAPEAPDPADAWADSLCRAEEPVAGPLDMVGSLGSARPQG